MYTIVCYGDSNTYGTIPATGDRHPRDLRWTGVVATELEGVAVVIEEGLVGRMTLWDDRFMDHRNDKPYLVTCLRSHSMKGAAFLDAASLVGGDPADGVHLNAADHGILGRAIASAARDVLG